MILDSTFLFDLMAEERAAFERGVELVEEGEMQWIPTPVLADAYYGAATTRSTVTFDQLRNHLLGYPRVDVDEEVARIAGGLLAKADDGNGGNCGVGWNDALIGAIGEILDEPVLTRNTADFEALGVPVETY